MILNSRLPDKTEIVEVNEEVKIRIMPEQDQNQNSFNHSGLKAGLRRKPTRWISLLRWSQRKKTSRPKTVESTRIPVDFDDEAALNLAEERDQEIESGRVQAVSHQDLMQRVRQ